MKRIGNLFNRIISYENLVRAEKKARLGKTKRYGVKKFDRNPYENLVRLQKALIEDTYRTSEYCVYTIIADRGNKEREIYRLPYYSDRIVHHAIMNVIEPYLVNRFTADTFNCLKGRGIHYGVKRLKRDLKADKEGTKYCLKLDIKKFFPSIDQDVLYSQFEKIFKDKKLLRLLHHVVYSTPKGLPIGNYISQFAANLNLTWFDRWIKQVLKIKYYYRYCDDIVILHPDKDYLRYCLQEIEKYLADNLKLKVKRNWQIFPVEVRGIDFIGYVFYHGHTLLRKDIKKKFIHKLSYKSNNKRLASLAAYWGWCKYGSCHNLWYRFTRSYNFKDYRQKLLSDDGIKESTG